MKPTSFRFSAYTEAQLQRLCVAHELQRNIVVALALERFEAQMGDDITKELFRLIDLQAKQLADWEDALQALPCASENETADEKQERLAQVTILQVASARLNATSTALNAISGLARFQAPPVKEKQS